MFINEKVRVFNIKRKDIKIFFYFLLLIVKYSVNLWVKKGINLMFLIVYYFKFISFEKNMYKYNNIYIFIYKFV